MRLFNRNIYPWHILVLFVALLVATLLFVGARDYMRWQGNHYFGEVIQITDSGFVISDAETAERVIDVSEQTVVKRGRETQPNGLQIGDPVFVVGEQGLDGHVKAVLIRVMERRGKNRIPEGGSR